MKPAEQPKSNKADHLKPYQFKPGQSGNPSGKRKGTVSLKKYAQKYIQELTDDEKLEFMRGLDKKVIWEMAEGKPESTIKATVKKDELKDLPDDELDRIIEEGESSESQEGEG